LVIVFVEAACISGGQFFGLLRRNWRAAEFSSRLRIAKRFAFAHDTLFALRGSRIQVRMIGPPTKVSCSTRIQEDRRNTNA